ncbi:MAG: hypothetical protein Q8P32_04880 [Candidatus Komeilibacteria bacterium]|nr:hypothetical protein [Candidatus Komeilibacteria bacterium]
MACRGFPIVHCVLGENNNGQPLPCPIREARGEGEQNEVHSFIHKFPACGQCPHPKIPIDPKKLIAYFPAAKEATGLAA